jgi:hypothetical protein
MAVSNEKHARAGIAQAFAGFAGVYGDRFHAFISSAGKKVDVQTPLGRPDRIGVALYRLQLVPVLLERNLH